MFSLGISLRTINENASDFFPQSLLVLSIVNAHGTCCNAIDETTEYRKSSIHFHCTKVLAKSVPFDAKPFYSGYPKDVCLKCTLNMPFASILLKRKSLSKRSKRMIIMFLMVTI